MLKGGKILLGASPVAHPYLLIDTLMLSVYETRKDPDGFLYIVYTEESTLGGEEML